MSAVLNRILKLESGYTQPVFPVRIIAELGEAASVTQGRVAEALRLCPEGHEPLVSIRKIVEP